MARGAGALAVAAFPPIVFNRGIVVGAVPDAFRRTEGTAAEFLLSKGAAIEKIVELYYA